MKLFPATLKRAKLIPARERESRQPICLSRIDGGFIFPFMNLKDGSNVVADLTAIGRKTGLPRTVEIRFVYYQGCFYASSSRVQGKHWCQNMIKNPAVEIRVKGEILSCTAKQVVDENLRKQVLRLRESPPRLDRVVFEIKPRS